MAHNDELWKTRHLKLKEKHAWKTKPGNNVCAINRGAICFEYPESWTIDADADSLKVRDHEYPADNCVVALSQMHLPVELADRVPLRELVKAKMDHDPRDILERKEIVEIPREDGIEFAYGEVRHMDPFEKREAFGRIGIARGSGIYCMITFEVWVDEVSKYEYAWQEVLRSLMLAIEIRDPTVGPVVH